MRLWALVALAAALLCAVRRPSPPALSAWLSDDIAVDASDGGGWCGAGVPLCGRPGLPLPLRARCWWSGGAPLAPASAAYRRYAGARLRHLLGERVVGNAAALAEARAAAEMRLREPGRRLVLLLAGDNGVGKTRAARLLALALTQAAGAADTLALSCAAYGGLPPAAFGRRVLAAAARHARRHPRGTLVLNDLAALEGGQAAALAPLLRPPPASPVAGLALLLTTDLGGEGGGREPAAATRARVQQRLRRAVGPAAAAAVQTVVLGPLAIADAEALAVLAARERLCAVRPAARLAVTAAAAATVARRALPLLPVENGRAVEEVVEAAVVPLLRRCGGGDGGWLRLSTVGRGRLRCTPLSNATAR